MNRGPCALCGCESMNQEFFPVPEGSIHTPFYACPQCGRYVLDEAFTRECKANKSDELFKIACLVREKQLGSKDILFGVFQDSFEPTEKNIAKYLKRWWRKSELLAEFPKPHEIIDRALLNVSRLTADPMESIKLSHVEAGYRFFCPKGGAQILLKFMDEMKFLQKQSVSSSGIEFIIAPGGWERISSLQAKSPESRQGFVAMWFADEMDGFYWEAIKPAIEASGFDCKRIDTVEHNNKICDEIIGEIRKSRFIVADFTGQRGGVYFEPVTPWGWAFQSYGWCERMMWRSSILIPGSITT